MKAQLAKVTAAMIRYDQGDARRIQHFIKVHDLAAAIGVLENLDDETQYILETAAILHDIGIHVSEAKYGSGKGVYQEIEGPPVAEKLLREVGGYTDAQIERVKYLIGHHHTYNCIEGMDYQILVEADFLVNLYEGAAEYEKVQHTKETIFKTKTGIQFLDDMFQK